MNPDLFPELPEDLGTLKDEELSELLSEHEAALEKVEANDPEYIGELSAEAVIESLRSGVEQIKAIKAELGIREEAQKTYLADVAALAAEAREVTEDTEEVLEPEETDELVVVAESEPEPEPDSDEDDDGAVVEEREVALVAAAPAKVYRRPPAPSPERMPRTEDRGGQLVASSGLRSFKAGETLGRKELATALIEAHRLNPSGRTVAASAEAFYPEDRRLTVRGAEENGAKIAAVTPNLYGPERREALVATGGLCAPFVPIYDLPIIASAARPVKDGLAAFQAERGGISFPTPLGLPDVEAGVTVVTAANDELGGTFATKACVTIDCDPYTDVPVEAIAACVTWGNFNARAWPERVENVAELLAAAHARAAEIELLDAIGAGSTATTDAMVYGAYSSLIQGILKAAAAYRSRHRMDPNAALRVLIPAHVVDLVAADLAHQQFGRMEITRSDVLGLLRRQGINVSLYMDSETGAGQIYDAQTAGTLDDFLDTVVWYMFHEGAWLFLDFGRLDLGVVRDSVLNATNDFQVFYETFEGAAMVGIESLKVTSTVCPSGEVAAPGTAITC